MRAKTDNTSLDPRGLIREAYRIEGITEADCRSIFFDWALGFSAPPGMDDADHGGAAGLRAAAAALLAQYGDAADHPMTMVLREGVDTAAPPAGRRGGRRARVASDDAD